MPCRDGNLLKKGQKCDEAGATYIDCASASVPREQEAETPKWMIDCIQEVNIFRFSGQSKAEVLAHRCFHTVKIGVYQFCFR